MANIYVAATATWNGKALAKGKKDINSFEKSVKSLGRTLGISLGAAALVNFGKKAVDAFSKDQAAAKSLEQQLKNTGYAFSAPDIEYYIANLQKMTGVLDDQLRPAFQTLLTASGSLIKSQKALALALDISAGTGKSVEEVSMALAKGFSGQTTALSRLGAGIDKATLASGDMDKIMGELQSKFSGQAKARLETYAGKMDQLKVATADATEIIGKGLLDALSTLGKDQSLDKFSKDLNSAATAISYLVAGVAKLAAEVTKLASIKIGNGNVLDTILRNLPVISAYYNAGKSASMAANAPKSNFTYSLGSGAGSELAKLQEVKARKALIVQLKAEADLKKLKDKYDVERIGLMAALNAATDEETKLRLAEKLAILDGNAAMAAKYLAERNAEQGLVELAAAADDAKSAFQRLSQWNPLSGLVATQADLMKTGVKPNTIAGATNYDPLSSLTVTPSDLGSTYSYNPLSGMTVSPVTINIDATSMVDSANMTKVVQEAFLQINKNGYSTVPAGQGF